MFFVFLLLSYVLSYLPVVILHGFYMGPEDMQTMIGVIQKDHPNTDVVALSFFNKEKSAMSLMYQVRFVLDEIIQLKKEKGWNEFNLIGFSQGGAISRAVLEMMENNTVHTYISLAGVQMGFFSAIPSFMMGFLPPSLQGVEYHDIYKYFYTPDIQFNTSFGSIPNAWHDPFHRNEYFKGNLFFGDFNNEGPVPNVQYKENFLKTKIAHFFTSPVDGVVTPYQSSIFGYYSENSESNITNMDGQDVFLKDRFGLMTMFDEGRLFTHVVDNVPHMNWALNEDVIRTNVVPLLN